MPSAPRSGPAVTTPEHAIQLRYQLSSATIKTLCSVPTAPDRRQVLYRACLASEMRSFPLKSAEKSLFFEINDHTAIPYPIKDVVAQPWHKVFLLVQINLLRTGWPNKISLKGRKELYQEQGKINAVLDQVLRCLVDILGARRDGLGVSVALDVLRSVRSGAWEGGGQELLLVNGIGAAKLERLTRANVKSIQQLGRLDFCHIERLLSRNPPFGHHMVQELAGFPRLCCDFDMVGKHAPPADEAPDAAAALWICRVTVGYENESVPVWKKKEPWVTLVIASEDGGLLWFWRGCAKSLAAPKTLVLGLPTRSGDKLSIQFSCEEIIGTMVRLSHQVP